MIATAAATPVAAVTNCRKVIDEHLREVRQAGLAAVVLQVRVRREARDRVERERRLHVADAVRIERQVLLQRDDRERREPHEDVRDQQRQRVLLPVLLLVRVDAGQTQHEPLDRDEEGIEQRALPGEHLRTCSRPSSTLVAIVNRIVNATATYSVPMDASELFRAQHRVHEVHERRDAQQQRDSSSHDFTYTRSQKRRSNPNIAANVASPRANHSEQHGVSFPGRETIIHRSDRSIGSGRLKLGPRSTLKVPEEIPEERCRV